ncbi:MAG: hypothetical protein ACRDGR_01205 [bacterium]
MRSKSLALFAILFGAPIVLLVPVWIFAPRLPLGSIEFDVQEKGPYGCRVSGSVPAMLIPAAVRLAPRCAMDDIRREIRGELGDGVEIVEAALRELARCPDGVLVDVRTATEVVKVEKRDGRLRVHVDTPCETVRAVVPLDAVRSFVSAI